MKELPNDAKIDMEDKKVGDDVPFDFGQNEDDVKNEEEEEDLVGEQPPERSNFENMPSYFDYDEITFSDEENDEEVIDDGMEEGGGRNGQQQKKKVDLNEL